MTGTRRDSFFSLRSVPGWAGLLLIWSILAYLLRPVLEVGIPGGNDSMGHLFKLWYLGRYWQTYHALGSWTPYWYCGTDLLKYYPPLFYLVTLPIQLLTGDAMTTYRIFVFIWAFGVSASFYYVVSRINGPVAAFVTTMFFVLAPTNIRVFFWGGGLPSAFSMIFLPWAFYLTLKLLQKPSLKKGISLAFVLSLFILAHAMNAAFSMITLLLFAFVYLLDQKPRSLGVLWSYLAAAFVAVMLSVFWLAPAYLGRVMPPAPLESINITSISLSELLGSAFHLKGVNWSRYFPITVLLLGLAGVFRKNRRPLDYALFIMGIYALVFSMGVHTFVFRLLPLSSTVFPEYVLFNAIFAFALLAGGLFRIDLTDNNRWLSRDMALKTVFGLIVSLVFLFDVSPAFRMIPNRPVPSDLVSLLNKIDDQDLHGRISYFGLFASELTYFPTVITGHGITEGFFFQGTQHFAELANFNYVLGKNLPAGYISKKLALWNSQHLLMPNAFLKDKPRFVLDSFRKVGATGNWNLFKRDRPPGLFQKMDRDVLVIGKYAPTVAIEFPWVAEGNEYIDDYEQSYLQRFKTVILTGFAFHDRTRAEDMIKKYASRGGRVIIDLQGMKKPPLDENAYFLGVTAVPVTVEGKPVLLRGSSSDSLIEDLHQERLHVFQYKGKPWKTIAYIPYDLDKSLLKLKQGKDEYPVLGTKSIGGKPVFFVGLNLFYHVLMSQDREARQLLLRLVGEPEKLELASFPARQIQWKEEYISFSYWTSRKTPVLVSITWMPNWRAKVDGQEIKVHDHENLVLLLLPAGHHRVEISFGSTPFEMTSRSVSAITLLSIGFLMTRSRLEQKKKKDRRKRKP